MLKEIATLEINGELYRGWTSVKVNQSIETLCGKFDLALADKWTPEAKAWPLDAGTECRIKLGDDLIITGYLDTVNPSFSEGSHSISVSGRDKTADLVDCSAVHDPGEWKGLTLDRLASELAKPFGLSVKNETDVGDPFKVFKIQPGETSWTALERACRQRGVMVVTDNTSQLVLTKPGAQGKAATVLEQGLNVLSASANYNYIIRYSDYIVRGQQQGSDSIDPETAAQTEARAKDAGVKRYRPLLVIAEGQADNKSAKNRAEWEATNRAARAASIGVTVPGWRMEDGELWAVNKLVEVKIPYLQIESELLISVLDFSVSEGGGTTTRLQLRRKDAFEKMPEIPEQGEPGKKQ